MSAIKYVMKQNGINDSLLKGSVVTVKQLKGYLAIVVNSFGIDIIELKYIEKSMNK